MNPSVSVASVLRHGNIIYVYIGQPETTIKLNFGPTIVEVHGTTLSWLVRKSLM